MNTTKYHLKRNQQYHFYILYNVHPETLSKLNYKHFNVRGMSVDDPAFNSLISEISGLQEILKEFLEELYHIKGNKISYILFSKDEENLARFLTFLTILRPSRIFLWVSFETQPEEFAVFEPGARNLLGPFSEWEKIFNYYEVKQQDDLFYLVDQDLVFANRLIRNFNRLYENNKSFPELIGLYGRAYGEGKLYFKYLLLLMIIESFISSSGNENIKYKLCRMCAMLIGEDTEQCKTIFKGASDAYNIRSKLVHSANFKIERTSLLFVHSMVCEILLLLLVCGIEKNKVFDMSTQMGYGQRNSLIKERVFNQYGPIFANSINLIFPSPSQKHTEQQPSKKKQKTSES